MRMKVLPWPTSEVRDWRSINQLMTARFDTTSDPTGTIRRAEELWREAREAFLQDASGQFGQRSAEFILVVTKSGPTLGDYPTPAEINLELAYHKWRPFRVAWVLAAFTFVLVLVSLATGNRACYALALVAFSCALAVMCIGLGWRVAISGHAPVTNMYESIVYMGFGTSLIGLILELRRPQKLVLAASSVISAAVLLLADSFPTALDPGFRPLPPALRNDFWLVIHVLTVTFSYSAFAVALGIGNMTLGYFLVRSRDGDTMAMLGRLNYRCIQVGVLFLAVGTVTGGIWADYSWGRFWGWDPKEVWALITLFGYLAVLHARYVDWVGQFGMAALSVICFSFVVITWYGVNFLLGSGLHTYGGGSGGRVVVGIWLFVQFCFVGFAAARSAGHSADLPENVR